MAENFSWEQVLKERGMLPEEESGDSPAVCLDFTVVDPEPEVAIAEVPQEVLPDITSFEPTQELSAPEEINATQEEPVAEAVEQPQLTEPIESFVHDGAPIVEAIAVEEVATPERFGPPEFCGPPAPEQPADIPEPEMPLECFGPLEFVGPLPAAVQEQPEPEVLEVVAEVEAEPVHAGLDHAEHLLPLLVDTIPVPAPPKPALEVPKLFTDRQELALLSPLLTPAQMKQVKARQKQTREPLGAIAISLRFVTEKRYLQACAHQLGVSPWPLETDAPKEEAYSALNYELCKELEALPVAKRGDLLIVAMSNPAWVEGIEAVRAATHLRIEPVLADRERLMSAIEAIYRGRENRQAKPVDSFVEQAMIDFNVETRKPDKKTEKAILTEAETRPVIGLVNQVVADAIRMKASDIHLEPREDHMEIRYRIDGQLLKVRQVPQELIPMLVTRIKIMAEVDIVEHRMPQDGRTTAVLPNGSSVDLRISVLPNVHGPRVVMRILDKSVGLKAIDELGFDPENLALFRSLVRKPYGLFLVTGPTGSGKTTTLYSALNDVKNDHNNVMTCEDPVEYDLPGINQSQVNEKVGLTFSKQLRAILRQDPDIVLVGEIRDQETAETAIRAALTGHLVLSTLHCNDAPSSVPRLLDMGIDPYLLSTSMIGAMGQRLLRKLCVHCREEREISEEDANVLAHHFDTTGINKLYHAKGCERCFDTGYLGRMAVHEILPVTEEIGNLVASRAPVEEIRESASYYGYQAMQVDALNRVLAGETTLDEARRLLFFDTIVRTEAPRRHHLRAA